MVELDKQWAYKALKGGHLAAQTRFDPLTVPLNMARRMNLPQHTMTHHAQADTRHLEPMGLFARKLWVTSMAAAHQGDQAQPGGHDRQGLQDI